MRKLQQLPQLSSLVVVEHGLLGKGQESEVSQTLLPDGGGARAPRIDLEYQAAGQQLGKTQ